MSIGRRLLIIVVGKIGVGKTVASEYLAKEFGFDYISAGAVARDLIEDGKDCGRAELQKKFLGWLNAEGAERFGQEIGRRLRNCDRVVIDGLRVSDAVQTLGAIFGEKPIIVHIWAQDEKAFLWQKNREKEGMTHREWKEFEVCRENELERLDRNMVANAEFTMENFGGKDELFAKLDGMMCRNEEPLR
jgi:cytidylate kinase